MTLWSSYRQSKDWKRWIFIWKYAINWGKGAQNWEFIAPKMRSASAPSKSVVGVTPQFSERTFNWEKVLKRSFKSDQYSRFSITFNMLCNKKTPGNDDYNGFWFFLDSKSTRSPPYLFQIWPMPIPPLNEQRVYARSVDH